MEHEPSGGSGEPAQLIAVPGRLARSARRLLLDLPTGWPWEQAWGELLDITCGPTAAAT